MEIMCKCVLVGGEGVLKDVDRTPRVTSKYLPPISKGAWFGRVGGGGGRIGCCNEYPQHMF